MTIERIEQIQSHVRRRLQEVVAEVGAPEAPLALQKPPRPDLGDVAIPCFPLAKVLRKAPPVIAKDLAARLTADEIIDGAVGDGGFLNVTLNAPTLARVTIGQVLAEGAPQKDSSRKGFGAGQADEAGRVVVEYSSPNTNKPLHLGHVRNNTLGLAVCRILAHAGHDVSAVCLVNDRGIHICKTMVAYERWGDHRDPLRDGLKGDHFVGDLYVEFARRFETEYKEWLDSDDGQARFQEWRQERQKRQRQAEKKGKPAKKGGKPAAPADEPKLFASSFEDEYFNSFSPLGGEARQLLRRWEAGDDEVRELWQRMNSWVYEGFDQTYRRLGVAFDRMYYESNTYTLGRQVVDKGLEQGHFRRLDDDAVVADYETLGIPAGQIPYKVLLRGDGTTVYTTQDLGTALARHDELKFDRQIYVVGDEQKHHFRVLFALLGLVRPELANACSHLAYGMVNLPEGKMKSREGKVVDADQLMDDMTGLAEDELRSRSASGRAHSVSEEDQDEIRRRAEVIAQGALKFYLLSFNGASTMTFDPRKSIDFQGKTGPYCLNAYGRTRSIISRAGGDPALDLPALETLESDRELNIVRALAAMPAELRRAEQSLDPARVVDGVYEVARAFNQLYTDKDGHPIITCDDAVRRAARLQLTAAVSVALKTGLHLLGIEVLEEM